MYAKSARGFMIYTASYYDPHDWVGQAFRVSRAHPRGRRTQWQTMTSLYPPLDLLRAYRAGDLDFPALAQAYRQNLDQKVLVDFRLRRWLEQLPEMGDVTLLCFERGEEPCHRRVAAQWLSEQIPQLQIGKLN